MFTLNGSQLMWLTTLLFLAITAAAAQGASPLLSDVALPRSVEHKIVSNKLIVFLPKVRLCRKLLNGLAGLRVASGRSRVPTT